MLNDKDDDMDGRVHTHKKG